MVARWDLSDLSDAGFENRYVELAWFVTLLTGATSRPGYPQRIDFFLVSSRHCLQSADSQMHALTSSLFLPAFMTVLSAEHRRMLLQTYLLTMFQIMLTRGRPHIFPKEAMS